MCVEWITTIIMTGLNSVRDFRKREIFLVPTLLCGAAGLIFALVRQEDPLLLIMASYVPGLLMLLFSILSGGALGRGDAFAGLALGGWLTWEHVFMTVCTGFLGAGIWAGILLIRGKNGKKELPFVPFLLAGEILTLVFF